jgi:hypothetical protein
MMRLIAALGLGAVVGTVSEGHGQRLPRADSSEVHYYDRWPGVWYRVDPERVDSLPTFEVHRGPGNSFLETWHLVIDGQRTDSFGLRSWDPETDTWRLIWVSDTGLFQIWDGIKLEHGWYIIRKFGDGPDSFLSRQAWIPQGSDHLLRTIERSTDGGRTWTVRYRNLYQRATSHN